jgi:formylglycine-generating enzyme required for sulfatase activity
VTVGNAGNFADTTGYGAVGYAYDIGKHEVTNTQYAAFLNAVARTDTYSLYNTNMAGQLGGITRSSDSGGYTYALKSGFENKAVNFVSFWDAARFANWLNNGQGSGSTETGGYTLTSGGIIANTVTRSAGANWVVAGENEWYKAAYFDPAKNSGAGGYWSYATRSDTLGNNTDFTAANGANHYDGDYAVYNGGNDGALPVGTYANAASFYGTFDQGGNLREWNDAVVAGTRRGLRDGSWYNFETDLRSSSRSDYDAADEVDNLGFRVASLAPIPEPSAHGAAMGLVTLGVVMMRRRKSRGTF